MNMIAMLFSLCVYTHMRYIDMYTSIYTHTLVLPEARISVFTQLIRRQFYVEKSVPL